MPQLIYESTNSEPRRLHLPAGSTAQDAAQMLSGGLLPIADDALYIWLADTDPAASAPLCALSVDFDAGTVTVGDSPAHDPAVHAIRWDGSAWVVEPRPVPELQAAIGTAVQDAIDAHCRAGVPYFRDIFSARGYVGDPNPAYHARAVLLRDWSSAIWTTLDTIQDGVLAGNRPPPTIAEILAELPAAP